MASDATSSGLIYVVSAPSGGGKTSVIAEVINKLPNVEVSISHTTRSQRPGEIHGQHYHFINHETFEHLIAKGEMFEYAKVFEHYYGTSFGAIAHSLQKGIDVVLDIDWQGARQVRKHYPEQSVSIFIMPPSKEVLYQRLKGRGQDSEEVIQYRMNQAKSEMSHFNEYDYVIINEDFQQAVLELQSIMLAERLRLQRQVIHQKKLLQSLVG